MTGQQITTAAELDALPVGSVVLDCTDWAWQRATRGGRWRGDHGLTQRPDGLGPFRVLYRPDAPVASSDDSAVERALYTLYSAVDGSREKDAAYDVVAVALGAARAGEAVDREPMKVVISAAGAHGDGCRTPDEPCSCGLAEFRRAALEAVKGVGTARPRGFDLHALAADWEKVADAADLDPDATADEVLAALAARGGTAPTVSAEQVLGAWHDVTCPEGKDCRSRSLHALGSPADTGFLVAFLTALGIGVTLPDVPNEVSR